VTDQTITSVSRESRIFKPSAEFKNQANLGSYATYRRLYAESVNAPDRFWGKQAKEFLAWRKPFSSVLKWKAPHAKWFSGGQLNVAENCLDRHLKTARANKAAIIFEGEPGDVRTLTYAQLHREVCKFANVLESLGLKKGDRAAIYMPMVPEAAIAMLACARVGVIHTVIFGGFSAEAIKDRVNDCQAKLIITADGGWRRGKVVELKTNVDRALVARFDGDRAGHAQGEGPRQRNAVVHSLHLGLHRETEGRVAHQRRLSVGHDDDVALRLRFKGDGRLLVHRRYWLDHRA
jgi:acetyl-CoA synthetase